MKFKNWTLSPPQREAELNLVSAGISPLAAKVLSSRGCLCAEDAQQVLSTDRTLFYDPMALKGMPEAVTCIRKALAEHEKICVYGDYDVDGITATCLLTDCLRRLGGDVTPYIPNRLSEGYSLNPDTVTALRRQGISFLITVDCGITNIDETTAAQALGMKVVITDHHECKSQLPAAQAVVNPHQPGCPYPFKQLAGVGVAFKLASALLDEDIDAMLNHYADLAAIGTVADVMSLTGENRALVAAGLELLPHTQCIGLSMLLRESGLDQKPPTATSISYSLAPRINAAGRMGCPELALQLLLCSDPMQAEQLARQLCDLNRERQAVELSIFNQCTNLLEQHPDSNRHAIILSGEHWHQGVIGIVASRLVEQYGLPTFMICIEDGRGKGSCRSTDAFNLFSALEQCADLLDTFGGHEQAAGFTIAVEHLSAFRQRMLRIAAQQSNTPAEEAVSLRLDSRVEASLLTAQNVSALHQLEPFGCGNPRPTFLLERAAVTGFSSVGSGRHTRLHLTADGIRLDAIFFSTTCQELSLRPGLLVDIAFYPHINEFRGNKTVQLMIADLRRTTGLSRAGELSPYWRYLSGALLSQQELALLIPNRQDFVAVWKYLSRQCDSRQLEETPAALSAHILKTFGHSAPCSRTMICLEVFRERGLIDWQTTRETLTITLLPTEGKVDLEASEVMRTLREHQKKREV